MVRLSRLPGLRQVAAGQEREEAGRHATSVQRGAVDISSYGLGSEHATARCGRGCWWVCPTHRGEVHALQVGAPGRGCLPARLETTHMSLHMRRLTTSTTAGSFLPQANRRSSKAASWWAAKAGRYQPVLRRSRKWHHVSVMTWNILSPCRGGDPGRAAARRVEGAGGTHYAPIVAPH